MLIKSELKHYLETEKDKMYSEFSDCTRITEDLFEMLYDFLRMDFDELSDNRVYRCFLESFKDMICFAFKNDMSKVYLRNFFKVANDDIVLSHFCFYAKSRKKDIKFIMSRFVNFFTMSWQGHGNDKDAVLAEILKSIDYWM